MAIYRLLTDTTFEPEAVEAMGRAYEDLLGDLGIADRNDPFTEIVAKEIVKIASRGVRSAAEIRVQVLTALGKSAGPNPRSCRGTGKEVRAMPASFARKLAHFIQLSELELAVLRSIPAQVRDVQARTDIVADGHWPDELSLITEGFACRYKLLGEGQR